MTTSSRAAAALVLGSLAGLATMLMHPTGHDVINNAATNASNALNAVAHSIAILAQPLLLLGTLALTARLAGQRDLAVSAYVFYAMAVVAVLIAAVASGFVSPSVLRGYANADEAARQAMLGALQYTGRLNQAFAKVHVGFSSIAILLWSIALWRTPGAGRGLPAFGIIASALAIAGIASGKLRLDIHGFGAIVLTQGIWMVWTAAWLRWQEG